MISIGGARRQELLKDVGDGEVTCCLGVPLPVDYSEEEGGDSCREADVADAETGVGFK